MARESKKIPFNMIKICSSTLNVLAVAIATALEAALGKNCAGVVETYICGKRDGVEYSFRVITTYDCDGMPVKQLIFPGDPTELTPLTDAEKALYDFSGDCCNPAEAPVSPSWVTVELPTDTVAATNGWGSTGNVLEDAVTADGGTPDTSSYAGLKAALVAAGYTIVTADSVVPQLVVTGATIPPTLKFQSASLPNAIQVTWVAN